MAYGNNRFMPTFFLVLFVLAMILGAVGIDFAKCSQVSDMTGRKTEFRLLSGCYVEVEGRMVPQDSWRGEVTQ